MLEPKSTSIDEIRDMLGDAGKDFVVEYSDWLKVDRFEREHG